MMEPEKETTEDTAIREQADMIRQFAESELQEIEREREIFRRLAEASLQK